MSSDADVDARSPASPDDPYALDLADGSYAWYRLASIRSKRYHRLSAIAVQVLAAAIPLSAAIASDNAIVPAILGAMIVVISGVRSVFSWEENYLRYSRAREDIEAQRRFYRTLTGPYSDRATRDQVLVAEVTRIENDEMAGWFRVVSERRPQAGDQPPKTDGTTR